MIKNGDRKHRSTDKHGDYTSAPSLLEISFHFFLLAGTRTKKYINGVMVAHECHRGISEKLRGIFERVRGIFEKVRGISEKVEESLKK